MRSGVICQALDQNVDVLAIHAMMGARIHEIFDQMNTQTTDLPVFDTAAGVGGRADEWIERDAIVSHDCRETFGVRRQVDLYQMLVAVLKGVTDHIVEEVIESDCCCPVDFRWQIKTSTKFFKGPEAAIDLAEVVFQPQPLQAR